jgi:TRAP-type C4-dicarboxylate transport system substrate-binding protein
VSLLKYIGADPLTMNQSEVYTSLQQGTIDACENTLDLLVTQNTLEVVKFISLWNYSYDPIFLVVSHEMWAKLSADEKKIFQGAADESMKYQIQITREKEKIQRAKMADYKVAVVESLTDEEVYAFKEIVQKVYIDNEKQFGELFKEFGYTAK